MIPLLYQLSYTATIVRERPQKGRNDARMVAEAGREVKPGGPAAGGAGGLTRTAQVP